MPAVAGPLGDGLGDPQSHRVEVDIGVGPGVVDRRRNLVVVQRECDLGQARRTGRGLQVAHVGLDRPEQCGLVPLAATADHPAERIRLDRVAENRAGAVCLDVIDCARVDPGVAVGPAEHVGLGVGVGREHAVGPAVVVDRAAGDHGQDPIAVASRVGKPLENQHAAALRTGVAVGVGRERLDPAVGRQDAADLIEAQRHRRGDQSIDPAGEDHVGLAGAQRLNPGVHGDQRRRTRGVDRHRRAAEVVEVGHPVGDDRTRGAGDGVGVRGARVHHRQVAVVVGGAADKDPDAGAAQARRRDAGVLEGLPGQLERESLLRVDVVGFHLRQREELGVESLQVGQISAPGAGLGDPLGKPRLVHELRPATLRQVGDGVAAFQQRIPHLVGGVHLAGESGSQPDDRDIGEIGCAGPVLVGIDGLGLRFALDNHRRQSLDGGVPEGHRRRQGDPGEILDVAGHRHRVARGQAQLDHRDGFVDRGGRLSGGIGYPVAQPLAHLGHRQVAPRRRQLATGYDGAFADVLRRFVNGIVLLRHPASPRAWLRVLPGHASSSGKSLATFPLRRLPSR